MTSRHPSKVAFVNPDKHIYAPVLNKYVNDASRKVAFVNPDKHIYAPVLNKYVNDARRYNIIISVCSLEGVQPVKTYGAKKKAKPLYTVG